jgi:AraC-like DNA-binding protein
MTWDGSVVIYKKRLLFCGEAGQSRTHETHALLICAAYNGTFSLQIGPPGGGSESYSSAVIEAGTQHSMDGRGAEFVALMYLLPETEAAREVRRHLAGGRVGRLPKEVEEKLTPLMEEVRDYWRLDCEKAGRFFDGVLDELIDLPPERRDRLGREINPHVRRAIEELYSRMDDLLGKDPPGREAFTPKALCATLGLPEIGWDEKDLAREFKKCTGASFGDYVKLLRLRSTLVKLALNESDLRKKLRPKGEGKAPGAEAADVGAASDAERETARRISLTEAAKLLGWGELFNLNHASTDILGISPNSLRLSSRFISCGG